MSTSRGIFDPFATSESNGAANPFSFASETAPSSPFAAAPLVPQSPFAAVPDEAHDRLVPEAGRPAKIPSPRSKAADSPFQIAAETAQPLGYQDPASSPFATVGTMAPAPAAQSPFSVAPAPAPVTARPSAPALQPMAAHAMPPQQSLNGQMMAPTIDLPEEHVPYRQLELRAIFGVDREMSAEEILQRTRSLPGIRHVARIGSHEVGALDTLKRTLQALGFGGGQLRLYSGSVPIEFVRDGNTILAVQTDGGFAPGIRETIMIVARELDKMGSL
jgi:hypothetical protein